VIGVTSHAYSAEEDCYLGGVDTRVDAYLDWIEEAMIAACDDGTRSWCDEPGIPDPGAAAGDDDDDDGGDGCQDCSSEIAGGDAGLAALPLLLLLGLRRRR
jgi:MYXO-CTERM domain-containing protein